MKLIFFLLIALCALPSFAYVNFIGHSYTSCLNCHYNPSGGGALNDYGRVVSATLVSSGSLYPKDWSEEKIAYTSGFLFRKPKQNILRTQLNYRGFQLVRDPGSKSNEQKRWINMQADARVILKLGQNDRFIAVLNYGYSPVPETQTDRQTEWRSREHYLGYRVTPKFGVYTGLMDKTFGLKVIEHTSFSRVTPQATQNDQTHGVMLHYLAELWEGFAHGFVGNLSQDEDLRMKGGSLMGERTVFSNHRLGASAMVQKNNYSDLLSYSAHGKFNLKEGSALLAEIGQTTTKTKNGISEGTARYGLLQTYLRPIRGLYFLTNIEYFKKDVSIDQYLVRWGPGVQYFPIQRIELRFDIYNTRSFDPDASTPDTWSYLFQTHLWL
jgi:hypothetical protein